MSQMQSKRGRKTIVELDLHPDLVKALSATMKQQGWKEKDWLLLALTDAICAYIEAAAPTVHTRYDVRRFEKGH
jgi:hypothetical protein